MSSTSRDMATRIFGRFATTIGRKGAVPSSRNATVLTPFMLVRIAQTVAGGNSIPRGRDSEALMSAPVNSKCQRRVVVGKRRSVSQPGGGVQMVVELLERLETEPRNVLINPRNEIFPRCCPD